MSTAKGRMASAHLLPSKLHMGEAHGLELVTTRILVSKDSEKLGNKVSRLCDEVKA